MAVTGQDKCPAFRLSDRDTGERFGLESREPGCRPLPLDWDKHKMQKRDPPSALVPPPAPDDAPGATPSSSWATATAVPSLPPAPPVSFHLSAAGRVKEIPAEDDQDPERSVGGSTIIGFFRAAYVSGALPLPLKSSPRSARTGPMKTGGGVFVLDHTRWTLPMKDAIDSLLQYHHGDKDILRLVDRDYADTVHRSAADPNSLLRPTTRFHISRYVKHLAKLLNTSSSLNTSPEKLLETQQLWYSLTEGSKTTSVPVVTMETAVVTPPTAALPTL
ncbi:hypothetical protein D4764_0240740 [Takifugu flavidus]|uniref:Uncharacterized protein n=1 Tax=Takifugu flavidus TaxID=433684 RepID=A0A5C6MFH4_9TELE|nr:hypothetical protein D4764_0240740 [Takifugu flavidus]